MIAYVLASCSSLLLFTLKKATTSTLQGRMADAPSLNGSTTSRGAVFSAIAAKQYNSDTVQFQSGEREVGGTVDGAVGGAGM